MTRRDDEPKYMQVAAVLREQIETFRLFPGQPLPPEDDLAKAHGVSRMTVRKALNQLRAEGLIVTTHGRGSVVRSKSHTRTLYLSRYLDEARRVAAGQPGADAPEQSVKVVASDVAADEDLAHLLSVPEGSPLIRRWRLISWLGIPEVLTINYYPRDLVAGTPLVDPDANAGGNIAELADIGVRVWRVEEAHISRLPTNEERETLRIILPASVMAVRRRMFDRDGRVVELARDVVYPGDRVEMVHTIDLSGAWPPD
jgi:GntR family transcriptional regulator